MTRLQAGSLEGAHVSLNADMGGYTQERLEVCAHPHCVHRSASGAGPERRRPSSHELGPGPAVGF